MKTIPSLLAAAICFGFAAEISAANITLSLSNRRVEAQAGSSSDVDFTSNLGLFNETATALSGTNIATAAENSLLSLDIAGDVLTFLGTGSAAAEGDGTSSQANFFLEFTLAAGAPISVEAMTAASGPGGGSVSLRNLTGGTTLFDVSNGGNTSFNDVLLPNVTYQLAAVATGLGTVVANGGGSWSLQLAIGDQPPVTTPDAGATTLLLGFASLGMAAFRRRR